MPIGDYLQSRITGLEHNHAKTLSAGQRIELAVLREVLAEVRREETGTVMLGFGNKGRDTTGPMNGGARESEHSGERYVIGMGWVPDLTNTDDDDGD